MNSRQNILNTSVAGNSYLFARSEHEKFHEQQAHKIAQWEIQKSKAQIQQWAKEAARKEADERYNALVQALEQVLPQQIETAVFLSINQNKGILIGDNAQKVFSSRIAADLTASLDKMKLTI